MSSTPVAIKLSGIRLDQLRQIAAALKLPTMSAAVTHMIRQQIAAGVIPDTVPGISVERRRTEIAIAFDNEIPAVLPLPGALALADALESVTAGGSTIVNMSSYGSFSVAKRGASGVSVKVPFGTGEGHPMANDIAVDLARVIRRAAVA